VGNLKVMMFADSFHPHTDGAVIAMDRQAEGLERRGHEVVVVAPDAPGRKPYPRRVHYLPSVGFKTYAGYRIVHTPGDVMEFVRKEKPDILHCHGLASMAILSLTAARTTKIPHLITFHTMANEAVKYYSPLPIRDDMIVPMVWLYLRGMLKRTEVVIAPSKPIKDELEANGVCMNACEVVPTGVDTNVYSPDNHDKDFLKRFGLDGKPVALHVGRLSHEKRLDIVLGAMKDLARDEPDLHLLVVGKGPAEGHYKRLASDLGVSDRVVFAGFLPDGDLATAYASCDMLVIASTFETQGLVVLEALASGMPVAGIRFRAIPEFVHEGVNGCLFDEESCAEAVRRCLARSDSMRINALATAREYSVDACTEKLERAYALAAEVLARTH
jgi:1,2-diacylglycerol 3-alpha-glucosyltransferase